MSDSFDSSQRPIRCRACGAALDHARLEGICPACAWRSTFEDESLEEESDTPNSNLDSQILLHIPGHRVMQELARGGMGIVYRALQLEPEREVALKMLLPHQLGSHDMRERFRQEIRAIAALEHPAILQVYHVGQKDGLPFFTMKLAAGGTLAQRKDRYAGDWRAIAQLMGALADAVQFAHERGVLHRDLKPGNVLFDEQDRPYVSDFGLAKVISAESDLTRSMDFLGTPHYVAPEVAAHSARQATTASDIYSLGAILYELLSGRPPFEAEGLPALLKKIADEAPVIKSATRPGHSALPEVPRDLRIICLKCLAKAPAARYGSARELAADLRHWLEGRPIQARPVSTLERVGHWVRRHPGVAGLSAALAVALTAGGFMLWKTERSERAALSRTQAAEMQSQKNLREALLAQAKALDATDETGQRWQALEALREAASIRPSLELRNEAAAALARPDLREVARFPANFGDAGSAVVFTSELASYVTPERGGGFCLRSSADQHVLAAFGTGSPREPGTPTAETAVSRSKTARWFVLSPDEREIAALLDDYSLEVWEVGAPEPKLKWQGNRTHPPVIAFHPNGTLVAGSVPGDNLFLQFEGGPNERRSLQFTNGRCIYARFDPAGRRLAVVRDPGAVEVWNVSAANATNSDSLTTNELGGQLLWSQPMRRAVPWLAWSPDGARLAVAADDTRGVRILSSADGQTVLVYSHHLLYPRQFEFDPAGRIVSSLGQDWGLRLWDARTGQDLVCSVGRHRVMRFSRDGSRLTTAPSDHELAILERAPDQVFREFISSASDLSGGRLAHSPDGRLLLVSYPQIRMYDTVAGAEVAVLQGPPLFVNKRAFFSADGADILFSIEGRGMYSRAFRCRTNESNGSLAVDWESEKLLAAHQRGLIWDVVQSGKSWAHLSKDGLELWPDCDPHRSRALVARFSYDTLAISRNGRWAAASESGRVVVWDFGAGQVLTNLAARSPDRLWFSPDNRWLVVSIENGYATWSTESWKPGATWEAHLDSGDPGEVSFSDDARFIAARQERQTFRLLKFPECQELVTLKPPLVVPVTSVCLSGDATRLWLLGAGYRVFEWNLAELKNELRKIRLDWEESVVSAKANNR